MVCFISFNRSVSSSWSSIQFWRKHIETRGMSQINMQKTYQLLIVVMLIGLSMARPNGNIESQVKNRLIAFHFTLISNMVIKWIKTIFSAFSLLLNFTLKTETSDSQLGLSDMEKSFPYYRPMQNLQYYTYDEPNTLDRYQLQYRSFYPSAPVFRGGGGGGSSSFPVWDPYRQMVSKRQTRYRQCYFNPISCFRK